MSTDSNSTSGLTPDEIAHSVRNAIANGVYKPGDHISQVELANRFNVSRIPLREALRTLVSEGLLENDSRRGVQVIQLDRARVNEVYDLRQLVEPSFAPSIMRHVSRADIEFFESMMKKMETEGNGDPDLWSRTNLQFHLGQYELAHLPIRFEMLSRLYYLLEPYSRIYVHNAGGRDRAEREHRILLQALKDGDAELYARTIVEHMVGAQESLSGSID